MGSLQWDIFCKVVDNFGDIGVCWRLSNDIASRGHKVRLWVDDASALAWMAPHGSEGVQVMAWTQPLNTDVRHLAPTDVLVEAFGCEPAPEFIASCAQIYWAKSQNDAKNGKIQPVWINLEYLTAESQAERNHGLPSPIHAGPAAGWIKWFFYPGFTQKTGGVLRELDLAARQARFNRSSWLSSQKIDWHGETLVSLFCYEPPALAALIAQLDSQGVMGQPVHLLVAAGRAAQAVRDVTKDAKEPDKLKMTGNSGQIGYLPSVFGHSLLSISYLPLLGQTDFDHLLWACDLNFVRGEDSLVRAIWAGKPFIWQIYAQDDDVHQVKLDAFLDRLAAPPSLRAFHRCWNAQDLTGPDAEPRLAQSLGSELANLPQWQRTVRAARSGLQAQNDLTSNLLNFVAKTR